MGYGINGQLYLIHNQKIPVQFWISQLNLFKGSRCLTNFEEEILEKTFKTLSKDKPTRPNRI